MGAVRPGRRVLRGIAMALLLVAIAAENIALQLGWTPVDLGDLYRRSPKLILTAFAALGILVMGNRWRRYRRTGDPGDLLWLALVGLPTAGIAVLIAAMLALGIEAG